MEFRLSALTCLVVLAGCSKADAPRREPATQAAPAKAEPAVADKVKIKADTAEIPDDVSRFIVRREGCDHFRGEEAYDEERGRFIRENLDQLCKGSDSELAALKAKYTKRADVAARLSDFEDTIE